MNDQAVIRKSTITTYSYDIFRYQMLGIIIISELVSEHVTTEPSMLRSATFPIFTIYFNYCRYKFCKNIIKGNKYLHFIQLKTYISVDSHKISIIIQMLIYGYLSINVYKDRQRRGAGLSSARYCKAIFQSTARRGRPGRRPQPHAASERLRAARCSIIINNNNVYQIKLFTQLIKSNKLAAGDNSRGCIA